MWQFSLNHFARAFKATTGISPYQYGLHCRVELVQQLLQEKGRLLTEVAVEAGFGALLNTGMNGERWQRE